MRRLKHSLRFVGLLIMFPLIVAGCRLPWEPSSEEVIRNMAEAMSTLTSFSFDPVKVTATGKFVDPDDYDDLVSGQEPQPTAQGTIEMTMNGQTETYYQTTQPDYWLKTDATLTLESGEYPFSFESRAKGSLVYMNFLKLPGLSDELFNLSGLTNKWWEIPRSQAPTPYYPVPQVEPVDKNAEEEEEAEELTEEQIEELAELYSTTYVFQVEQDFGKEKCANGNRAYHYKVRLDEEAAKALYVGYYDITGDEYTAQELDEFEEMVAAVAAMDIEIWVQTKDFYLCRATLSGDYKNPENSQIYSVAAAMEFSDFNVELAVEAPSPSEPFTAENVLGALGINVNSIFENFEENFGNNSSASDTQNDPESSDYDDLEDELQDVKDEFMKLFN